MIKQIAEKLLDRPLRKEDGIDSKLLEEVEYILELTLPVPLKEFYLCVGNTESFTNSFEQFVKPDELVFIKEKLVFLEENQGVCCWGVNANEDNPVVYQYTEESDEWYSEEVQLSEFLGMMLYYQFAQGGYEYGGAINQISDENLNNITQDWEKVIDNNGLVIYWQQGKLIWYFTDKTGHLDTTEYPVIVSVHTEALLSEMETKYGFKKF
jgi:hypothetical protein